MLAKADQAHSEDDVGVELRADAPARHIPGQEIVEMEALDEQQIGENRIRRFLGGAERRSRIERRERRDESLPQDFQELTTDEKRQHCEMERIQPAQPQQKKPSHAKAVEQPLLVVRRDDKAAQDEKEIDEKPGVAQERHIVQMAVDVQME